MDATELLAFKGRNGLCARLGELQAKIAELDSSPARTSSGLVSGGYGGGISNPTQRDALALIRRKEKIAQEITELEALIGNVGAFLLSAPHGEWVADYYLDPDGDITWDLLAIEAGVTKRTMYRWRDACLAWISERR